MKVLKCIRDIYDERRPLYDRLEQDVRDVLKSKGEAKNWFFLSRVKELKSFALKIETGRVSEPKDLEDFVACTIVVPTTTEISRATEMVLDSYDLKERRPRCDKHTTKSSAEFRFDDLRLYVAQRASNSGKNRDLVGMVFEVQIKTILQHAWSIATHDLIYKSNTVSWARERIAYQVKAMLEHAEVAIGEANRLARAPAVAKTDRQTATILKLINIVTDIWSQGRLPDDIRRLANNISDVLRSCDVGPESFAGIINAERRRLGTLPIDLSPYAFTIQALAQNEGTQFEQKFNRREVRQKIVIHEGMELPPWMLEKHPRIINLDQTARGEGD